MKLKYEVRIVGVNQPVRTCPSLNAAKAFIRRRVRDCLVIPIYQTRLHEDLPCEPTDIYSMNMEYPEYFIKPVEVGS